MTTEGGQCGRVGDDRGSVGVCEGGRGRRRADGDRVVGDGNVAVERLSLGHRLAVVAPCSIHEARGGEF